MREFDLLERLCDRLDQLAGDGASDAIRAGFARGTGGCDVDYLAGVIAARIAPDAASQESRDGARYGVPMVTGLGAPSPCRAWFNDPAEAAAYAGALDGEVWDLVEGLKLERRK